MNKNADCFLFLPAQVGCIPVSGLSTPDKVSATVFFTFKYRIHQTLNYGIKKWKYPKVDKNGNLPGRDSSLILFYKSYTQNNMITDIGIRYNLVL